METKIARYISLVLLLAVLTLAWSCKENEGQELFVTDMALGSGGIAYWVFDCDGELARPEDIEVL